VSKILTKDEILKADDSKSEFVEVPEWGGAVYVSTMTAKERDIFEADVYRGGKVEMANLRAKLVALTVVDKEGRKLFQYKDAELLGKKSARALDRLFAVAQRINGLTKEDIEDLAKNSNSGQGENSSSA